MYVTRIIHESRFSWPAQNLVQLEGDSCPSAHYIYWALGVSCLRRINHESYFCLAGAISSDSIDVGK